MSEMKEDVLAQINAVQGALRARVRVSKAESRSTRSSREEELGRV